MLTVVPKIKNAISFLFHTDGSLREKGIRSAIWVGISGIVKNSMTIIRSVVLARLLMPDVFSLMSIVARPLKKLGCKEYNKEDSWYHVRKKELMWWQG